MNEDTKAINRHRNAMSHKAKVEEKRNAKMDWEFVNGMRDNCYSSIMMIAENLPPLLRNVELISHLVDVDQFSKSSTVLTKDIREYSHRIDVNAKLHEGKTGPVKSITEHLDALSICETYEQWLVSFMNVVMPIYMKMVEDLDVANSRKIEKAKASQASGSSIPETLASTEEVKDE